MLFKHQSLWESTRFLRVRWPLEEAQFWGLSGGVISQHQTFPTSLWLKSFWKASMITDYAIKLFAHTYSCSLKLIRMMTDSWVTQTQLHRRWDKQIPTWPPADNSVCGERLGQGYSAGSALSLRVNLLKQRAHSTSETNTLSTCWDAGLCCTLTTADHGLLSTHTRRHMQQASANSLILGVMLQTCKWNTQGPMTVRHRGTAIYFLLIIIMHIILRGQLLSFIINYPNSIFNTHNPWMHAKRLT